MVSHNFHKIDPCREITQGYFLSVALHLAVIAGLPLKVIDGKFGITQRLADRNSDEC